MPSPQKPLIFIVPGAWHPSSAYVGLQYALQSRGYPTSCDSLPGLHKPNATCAEDAAFIRRRIVAYLQKGVDVLVVTHSYGTVPGSAAAAGLETEAGVHGGKLIGLVVVAGFLVPGGKSTAEVFFATMEKDDPPAQYMDADTPEPGLQTVKDFSVMLAGMSSERTPVHETMLLPQGSGVISTPSGPPVWLESRLKGKLAYVLPDGDYAIRPSQQRNLIKATGVEWNVIEVEGSHGVMLTRPEETADIIAEWCQKCQKF